MRHNEAACLKTVKGKPVMLEGVRATGELRGPMLEMAVEQSFRNATDKNVEVVYTFPLPWGAVLLGVDVVLGGKRLTGAVIAKQQAEAQYEEAVSEGHAAVMLERNGDGSYSLNLGNLAAGEACVVTLRYAQVLQYEQGGLRLLVPTVIAPRYGDPVRHGRLKPHQVAPFSTTAEYPFEIVLRLFGDLARARVASPSHPISVASADGAVTITLARRGALDRDFVLVVDQLVHDSMAVVGPDLGEAGGVAVLASFCPQLAPAGDPAIAVKVLVDCSGSMGGDSIDAARRALREIVAQLGDGDRFSLSRFGSTVEHRSRGLWLTTKATRTAAERWLAGLDADLGGTEMEAALESTFQLAHTVLSDVLLVTDGEISAIDSAITAVCASGHRIFAVGIGSSPAETHLRRLAEATGGACDFVAPGEAVQPAVLRMFSRLRSPRLTDVTLVWPEGSQVKWVSPSPRSVFDGDTVNVFALLRQAPSGELRLEGRRSAEQGIETMGRAALTSIGEVGGNLSRLAASVRLQAFLSDETPLAQQEAERLAVAYQLVTPVTNFVLVHLREDGDRATEMPGLHQVSSMLPAGWGGFGSVMVCESRSPYGIAASVAAPASFDDLDAPAVMRRSRPAAPDVLYSLASGTGDIPAFLRKESDGIDRRDARYWSEAEHYRGLTPLGIVEWLRRTPVDRWPGTYEALRQLGIGAGVIDWLELTFAERDGVVIPETDVVGAFLCVMSQPEIWDSLLKSRGLRENLTSIAERITSLLHGTPKMAHPADEGRLVSDLLAVLRDATSDSWPDCMFALVDLTGDATHDERYSALA